LAPDPHTSTTVTPSGTRLIMTIVHWRHRLGGEAHCLVRLYIPPASVNPLAIVSELRGNPDGQGIIDDMAAVAEAVLRTLPAGTAIRPESVVWIAHHGEFSYHDAFGLETFIETPLDWDGQHYTYDRRRHRMFEPAEVDALVADLPLDPVPEALNQLGWRY
jgi:hypothetical protein